MTIQTKTIEAILEPVGSEDAFPGEFSVVLSTSTKDREGDELKADEWMTPLPDSIQFNTDHSFLVKDTVGSGVPQLDADGRLVVQGQFATTEHAQNTRQLVTDKHIGYVSVAYRDTDDGRELINGSFVVVPANPEATVLASKSTPTPNDMPGAEKPMETGKVESKDGAFAAQNPWIPAPGLNNVQSPQQNIHDCSVAMGANCDQEMHDTRSGTKGLKDMMQTGAGVIAPAQLVQAIHDEALNLGAQAIGVDGLSQFLSQGMDYSPPGTNDALGAALTAASPALLPKDTDTVETSTTPVEAPADKAAADAAVVKGRARARAMLLNSNKHEDESA